MPGQQKNDSRTRLGIVGIPFGKGQPKQGVEKGPSELRNAGLVQRLTDIGCDVNDHGDVEVCDVSSGEDVWGNVKNPMAVATVSKKAASMVSETLQEDGKCLTLGGDHSIAIGSLLGHAQVQPDMCVLWVDAHGDINTPLTSGSGNIHGMPLSFLVKELEPYVPTLPRFNDIKSCLSAKNIAWIGSRDIDMGERKIIEKFDMTEFSMQEVVKLGISEVVRRALSAIDPKGDRPIHVSFDIDAMDVKLTPCTGTPVPGGLSLRETFYIAEEVAKTGRLAVLDVVEVNPNLRGVGDAAKTVETTLSVIERFYGRRREGIYPSGYEIPLAATVLTKTGIQGVGEDKGLIQQQRKVLKWYCGK